MLKLSRDELELKAAAILELERREGLFPAEQFVPNGKQEDFINMFGLDQKFVSMFCAANGVGKSAVCAVILTNIIFGPQNEWFKEEAFEWTDRKGVKHIREAMKLPLFNDWPYIKRVRIISDPNTIKSKIIPELEKWFPVNEVKKFPDANYEMGKEGKNYVCRIETKGDWIISIMSTEQAAKEFESEDVGLVWIDEPMPKDKFMATLARGRLGMVIMWGYTPLTFSAWIKEWMDEHCDGEYADYIEAEMEDNCKIHGVRGILEHENIQRIVEGMPEDEKEARAFGKFGHLIGRVHKNFRRKVHVIKPFPLDERKFTTYKALDPHSRTGDHVLYVSVDSKGTKYFSGEVISEGLTKLLYERMKAFETMMHFRIEGRLIDPSAYNDDQHKEEKSLGSMLYDLGESYVKGSKDLMACIKRTNDALDYQMNDGNMVKPPEMYVFDTCPVAIKQLEQYVWQEWKGTAKDEKQLNARPRDKDDHQVENMHRLLLSEPVFIPYQARSTRQGPSYEDEMKELDPYK